MRARFGFAQPDTAKAFQGGGHRLRPSGGVVSLGRRPAGFVPGGPSGGGYQEMRAWKLVFAELASTISIFGVSLHTV
jgi:hypothetical protein